MKDSDNQHTAPPGSQGHDPAAHFCVPCDVKTMALRLNLDPRRVQQLAKEGKLIKNERGEYDCPYNVAAYSRMMQVPKGKRGSGLNKKQEESLDIRNARDRAAALREWEAMVMRDAVVRELAPIVVTLKNGIRELRSTLANQVMMFCKEQAVLIIDKQVADHELMAKIQKILSAPLDDKLNVFAKDIAVWAEVQKDAAPVQEEAEGPA